MVVPMTSRTPRLSHVAVVATLAVALAGCGQESGGEGEGEGEGGAVSGSAAGESGDDESSAPAEDDTAEGAYAAWRASILDDDLEVFEDVSIDAAWSDIVDAPDNEAHHAALVDAAESGDLELPEDPESTIGIDEVLGEGDEEPDAAAWDDFAASIEDQFDVEVDDVASFVVPFDEAYDGEAAALFVRSTDEGWLFFGMEPAR